MTSSPADRAPAPWDKLSLAIGLSLSIALHALIWQAWNTIEPEPEIQPARVIEVSLMAPPQEAQPAPPPPQPAQPPVQPPKPKPQPKKPEKPKPKPTPKPEPQPSPEPVTEAPAAPEPIPAPPAPAKPAPAPLTEPKYNLPSLKNPPTTYPRLAMERHWEGRVLLRVHVLANGYAEQITVERSSGHEVLDESAAEQVKRWRFEPARRGDVAIDYWAIVPVEFKLTKH